MLKKLIEYKNLWIFILSIITTLSISLQVVKGSFYFDGNNFKWIVIIGILCILFSKALEKYNKRLLICSAVYGFIISGFIIVGYAAASEQIPSCKKDIFMLACKFEACFLCITSLMMIIIENLPKAIEKIKNIREYNLFTANKKSFIFVAIIIFYDKIL